MPITRPQLRVEAAGWTSVRLPPGAIAAKAAIRLLLPVAAWKSDAADTDRFMVADSGLNSLVAILEQYYPAVDIVETGSSSSTGSVPTTVNDGLFAGLDRDTGRRLYHALVRVLHPDAGGSHEAFVQLQELAERRGWLPQ